MKKLFDLTDLEIHVLIGCLCYIFMCGKADRKVESGY